MEGNAVAGPSSEVYAPAPGVDAPVRSVKGPEIIPTRIDAEDGVKVVPAAFENCHLDDLIALIASMLDKLITHNDRIPLTPTSLTRFHSRAPPTISITSYLQRISRYTNVEPCCLLILLPYVDKVCARLPAFTISSLTVHRFVIAGVSVGSKALSDAFCTNGRYARVGGVSIAEMNLLEKEFCAAIDWRLTTTGSVLAHYYTSLVRSHPEYKLPVSNLPINSVIPTVPKLAPPPSATSPAAAAPSVNPSNPAAEASFVPVLSHLLPTAPTVPSTAPPTPLPRNSTMPIDIDGPALIPAPEATGKPGSASNLPSPLGRSRRELLCSPTSNSYVDDGRHGLGGLEAAFVNNGKEERTVEGAAGGALDIGVSAPGSSASSANVPSGIANSRPPSNDSSPMVDDSSPAATSSTRDSMKSLRSATVEEVSPGESGMDVEEVGQNNHERSESALGQDGGGLRRTERNGG